MTSANCVDVEMLKVISANLKNKSIKIQNLFENECGAALQMGSECIALSGLDITQVKNSMTNVYNQLTLRINEFADFLNKTAEQYKSVQNQIEVEINQSLKDEIKKILSNITFTE